MLAIPTEPVLVLAAGTVTLTDELGNEIPGSGAVEQLPMELAIVPSRTNESRELGTREQVVTLYRVYAEGMVNIAATSRIQRASGMVLEVVGDPEWWPDAAGGVDHTETLAKVARG